MPLYRGIVLSTIMKYIYKNKKKGEQIECNKPQEDLEQDKNWELVCVWRDTKLKNNKIIKK